MKIDPKVTSNVDLQNEALKNAKGTAPRSTSGPTNEATKSAAQGDTFQLSSRHGEVQSLAAQAANVPEVRTERVAPLKAKVERGGYQPDSGKIADAMLAEHKQISAKA
jgi:negative regulator of flagellin synthesis FlgM